MTKRKRIGRIVVCVILLIALGAGVVVVQHSYKKNVYPHGSLTSAESELPYSIPAIDTQKANTPSVGYSLYVGDTLLKQDERGCITTLSEDDSVVLSVYETDADMKTTIETVCMPALNGVSTFGATHKMKSVIEEQGYSGSFPALYATGRLKMKSSFSKCTDYFVAYYLTTGKEKNLLLMVTCKEASQLTEAREFLDTVRASMQEIPYESISMEKPDVIVSETTETDTVLLDSNDRYEFRINNQSDFYEVYFQYSNGDAVIDEAYITNEYAPNYEPEQINEKELYWKIPNPWLTTYTIHVKADKDLGETSVKGTSKEGAQLTFTMPGKSAVSVSEDGYEIHEFRISEESENYHIAFVYYEKDTEIEDAYILSMDGTMYRTEENERYPYPSTLYWKLKNPMNGSYKLYVKPSGTLVRSHIYVLSEEAYNDVPERQGAPAD